MTPSEMAVGVELNDEGAPLGMMPKSAAVLVKSTSYLIYVNFVSATARYAVWSGLLFSSALRYLRPSYLKW